jgi:hypothetical protein
MNSRDRDEKHQMSVDLYTRQCIVIHRALYSFPDTETKASTMDFPDLLSLHVFGLTSDNAHQSLQPSTASKYYYW